jgi:hypothetical protein
MLALLAHRLGTPGDQLGQFQMNLQVRSFFGYSQVMTNGDGRCLSSLGASFSSAE